MTLKALVESAISSPAWEVEDSDDQIVVTVSFESGRTQRVRISELEIEGSRYIHLTSPIGSRPSLDAAQFKATLSLNLRSPHGAFALHGDLLLLTEVLPISIDPQTLHDTIEFLALHADRYEAQVFRQDAM